LTGCKSYQRYYQGNRASYDIFHYRMVWFLNV
jgi:hypothetical protein